MQWLEIFDALEVGQTRAAAPDSHGNWQVNLEVKEAILKAFKDGQLVEGPGFVDKHNLLPQNFARSRGVRLVPGGSAVRRGAYVAPGVIIMPPSYINIGAYVDEGTMVDSHVLVGSCAQVGKRVHLSAAVQLGGVLEPVGQTPVIIEDDAFLGAGVIVVEGIRVGRRAVLAPGVKLTRSIPVFDAVNERQLEPGEDIPEGAVVVPGTRPISNKNVWAREMGLMLAAPIIIKYRDERSDASLVLEEALR